MHPLLQEVARDYFSKTQVPALPLVSSIINEAFSVLEKAFTPLERPCRLHTSSRYYAQCLSLLEDLEDTENEGFSALQLELASLEKRIDMSQLNTGSRYYAHGLSLLKHTESDLGLKERRTELYISLLRFIFNYIDAKNASKVARTAKNVDCENAEWRHLAGILAFNSLMSWLPCKEFSFMDTFMRIGLKELLDKDETGEIGVALAEATQTQWRGPVKKAALRTKENRWPSNSEKTEVFMAAESIMTQAIAEYEKHSNENLEEQGRSYDYMYMCLELTEILYTHYKHLHDSSTLIKARNWHAKTKKLAEKFDSGIQQSIQKKLQDLAKLAGVDE